MEGLFTYPNYFSSSEICGVNDSPAGTGYNIQRGLRVVITLDYSTEVEYGEAIEFNGKKLIELGNYNNGIQILNQEAEKYLNRKMAIGARCVGTVPDNPNSECGAYIKESGEEGYRSSFEPYYGIFKDTDDNYLTDNSKMRSIATFYNQRNCCTKKN